MYKIDKKRCVDCGYCAYVCPFDSLVHHVDEKYWEIDADKCKQCGQCFSACVASAIDCDKDQQVVESIVIGDECIGCSLCSRKCPVGAISGKVKEKFKIDPAKCIRCGYCATLCRKDAVKVTKMDVFDKKGNRRV